MMFQILIPKRERDLETNSDGEKKGKTQRERERERESERGTRAVCFLGSELLYKDDITLQN